MTHASTKALTRLALAGAACLCLSIVGCDRAESSAAPKPPRERPAVPVAVAKAVRADTPVVLRCVGVTESAAWVTLKPQVSAMVREVVATDGADVKAGDVLVRLDDRPFVATQRRNEAELERAKALEADAKQLLARVQEAKQAGGITGREVEESQAKLDAAHADVMAAEAMLESARLDTEYCTVRATFAGRLGQVKVKPGAIVKQNETELWDLGQISPIDITFSVPESRLPEARVAYSAGELRVEAVPTGDARVIPAAVTFIDNKVDVATGMLRVRASADNKDRALWPGQFVTVRLILGTDKNMVVVPESAVQPSQGGRIVFVVGADQTVSVRHVDIRRIQDGVAVIEKGVEADETVVTDGQLRLAPGSKIEIKTASSTPAPLPATTAADAEPAGGSQ